MIRLLFRQAARFAKLTPNLYPQMRSQLEGSLSLKSLGEYFSRENREELLEVVMKSKLTPSQSNTALQSLLELCGTESDQELNLIVNVLKQKAINHTRTGDLASSVGQFEQAIATILLMENPDELVLSQLYKFIGDLYVQMGDLKKAEKSLKDSENLLKNMKFSNQEDEKYAHSGLACIYTQLCMICYREKKPMEAFDLLGKALGEWDLVATKFLQEYQLTCRLKCMLHILFKETNEAVATAKHFLDFMAASPEYNRALTNKQEKKFLFSQLFYLNILCSYQEQAKLEQQKLLDILKSFKDEKGEERTKELMMMVGIKPDRYQI